MDAGARPGGAGQPREYKLVMLGAGGVGKSGACGAGRGRALPALRGRSSALFPSGPRCPALSAVPFAAMTMQFISHRFPEDHDPTIGKNGPPRSAPPPADALKPLPRRAPFV